MVNQFNILKMGVVGMILVLFGTSTAFAQIGAKFGSIGVGMIVVVPHITHDPIAYFVSGHRIQITAEVTDEAGINLVRCYFKASEQADFVFVEMTESETGKYQGILPKPSVHTTEISYLFLVVNRKNIVVKTEKFLVRKADKPGIPSWQNVSPLGIIRVSTELADAPEKPEGFSDSITMDIVESSERFGVVAGIYSLFKTGGTTGAAAAATYSGTVYAGSGTTAATAGTAAGTSTATTTGTAAAGSTAGLSTAGIIGISAAAVAVGTGVAIAAANDDDDDEHHSDTGKPTVVSTSPASGECVGVNQSQIAIRFSESMYPSANDAVAIDHNVTSDTGLWVYSGSHNWSEDNSTLYIFRDNLETSLAGDTAVTVTLNPYHDSGLRDTAGNFLDTYTFTFTIEQNEVIVEW